MTGEYDSHVQRAIDLVAAVRRGTARAPEVKAFFDEATFTASYVVHDPQTRAAAIIDSVLDFDQASGRTHCTGDGSLPATVYRDRAELFPAVAG